MNARRIGLAILLAVVVLAALGWWSVRPDSGKGPLQVGISPYQDIAMLVNLKHLGLEAKYGTQVELRSLVFEDILPAVGSASATSLDVGFGSLTEFLTKFEKLNVAASDPIVFVYPLYVYKGGGFVSFDPAIEPLTAQAMSDPGSLKRFLGAEFGVQKQSVYEMMIFSLAKRAGLDPTGLRLRDMPLNDALLAASGRSIDIAAAGLTQATEATRRGGRVVLKMDDAGFAEPIGLICRESVLRIRESDIKNLVRMWFDSVAYVANDIDRNSSVSLDYLRKNSATRYTLDEYKAALEQEYLPRSIQEARDELIAPTGRYPLGRITADVVDYLVAQRLVKRRPPVPEPLDVK